MSETQDRSELVAQVTHVGGQLRGRSGDSAASPLLEELLDLARTMQVPTDRARDDSHVFLEAPEKIAGATWSQCGGILHSLAHHRHENCSAIAAEVAQRIARLAPVRR